MKPGNQKAKTWTIRMHIFDPPYFDDTSIWLTQVELILMIGRHIDVNGAFFLSTNLMKKVWCEYILKFPI